MGQNPSPDAASPDDFLPRASRALVALVAAEFLLLRLLNRMSGALPAALREPAATALTVGGTIAYDAAFLVAILVAFLVARVLWREDRPLSVLAVLWGSTALAIGIGNPAWPGALVLADVVAAGLLIAVVARALMSRPARFSAPGPGFAGRFLGSGLAFSLFLATALAAYVASLYLRVGDAVAVLGAALPARPEAYAAGEGLALLAAYLAALAFWRHPGRWSLLIPALAVVGVMVLAWRRADLLPLLAYWSFGFRMDLFFPLYLGALAAFSFALVNAWVARDQPRYLVYALLLLGLSGRLLADLYSVSIAVAAIAFLSLARRLPEAVSRPAESRAPAPVASHGD